MYKVVITLLSGVQITIVTDDDCNYERNGFDTKDMVTNRMIDGDVFAIRDQHFNTTTMRGSQIACFTIEYGIEYGTEEE